VTATTTPPGAVARPSAARVFLARTASRHPEWWIVAIALGAWVAVVGPHIWPDQPIAGAVHDHAGHHPAGHVPAGASTSAVGSYLHAGTAWLVMVLAMMLLVGIPRVRFVAAVCPGRIRARAIAQTVAGVLLAWVAVGAVISVVPIVVPTATAIDAPLAFVAIWLVAAAWQLTPWKWTALQRGHGVRVPRREGDGAARVQMGARHGAWCVASCGPAMVAMVLTGHPLLLMIGLTVGLATERVATRPVPAFRMVGLATTVLAVAAVGAGALSILGA
jgi:predicted metal-binding membrane protein